MQLTNIHNLPSGIFNAVLNSIQEPKADVIRVTELINPPICKQLALENWETITADASEFLWSLLGTGIHSVLANSEDGVLVEKRVTVETLGLTENVVLSGQVDRFIEKTQTIADYKSTSVWSYLFGIKPEWEAQLNLYKYLLERISYKVKRLTINMILRDWQMSKAVQSDYPNIPFAVIDIPVWDRDKTNAYIAERVKIHQSEPLPCSPDERWQRKSTFAVMKEGRKSAVRVKDTQGEAQDYLDTEVKAVDQKKCRVVERVGEALKCKSYCLVRDICPFNFCKGSM